MPELTMGMNLQTSWKFGSRLQDQMYVEIAEADDLYYISGDYTFTSVSPGVNCTIGMNMFLCFFWVIYCFCGSLMNKSTHARTYTRTHAHTPNTVVSTYSAYVVGVVCVAICILSECFVWHARWCVE